MELLANKVLSSIFLVFSIIFLPPSISDTNTTTDLNPQNITLKNCSVSSLNSIPNVSFIRELSLDFCDSKNPVAENFVNFSSLTTLKISNSVLKNWNNSTLNDLNYLKVLSLSANNIDVIGKWTSQPLNALNKLELQENVLKTISPSSFEFYPNLQSLDLSKNILETIEPGSLSKLIYLKHLNLSFNHLKYINETHFLGLEHLIRLELNYNEIEEITEKAFETNLRLQNLNLSGNKLKNLKFLKAKNLVKLLKLNLTKNSIQTLQDNSFESNIELINLDLSWNSIANLNKNNFEGLKSLEKLNISHNGMLNLTTESLQPLVSLRELVLASNNLSSLPTELFNFTPLIEQIDLSNNNLSFIEVSLFSKLPYLTNLKLNGNHLTDISFIATLPHAQLTLDLSENLFESSAFNMSQLVKFRKILIAGNTWTCRWLIEELVKAHSNIYFGHIYNIPSNSLTSELLNLTGIDCYDDVHKRNVMILNINNNSAPYHGTSVESPKTSNCHKHSTPEIPTPPPVVWPKLRAEKFDSRSVIIWMLIAIAIAFAALRLAQQFLENKNSKTYLRRFRPQRSDATEMEILHSNDDENSTNWTLSPDGKFENNRGPNTSIA